MMSGFTGSCAVTKPSPPLKVNHIEFVMEPARRRLGPHHEPLSCAPPQTVYGTAMSYETLYYWPTGSWFIASQLPPASQVWATPPSLPTTMCDGSFGSIHIA